MTGARPLACPWTFTAVVTGLGCRRPDLADGSRGWTRCIAVALIAAAALAWAGVDDVAAQASARGSALVSLAEHRVNTGQGVEPANGTLVGIEAAVTFGPRLAFVVRAAGGKLNADSASADDHEVAEGEALLTYVTVPWLALRAGLTARSFSTIVASQRWLGARVGAELRLPFVGDAVTGLVHGDLFPGVSVSGQERPNRAFAVGADMEWRAGSIVFGLRYTLERYDFPLGAAVARREQFSSLSVLMGLRLGRPQSR